MFGYLTTIWNSSHEAYVCDDLFSDSIPRDANPAHRIICPFRSWIFSEQLCFPLDCANRNQPDPLWKHLGSMFDPSQKQMKPVDLWKSISKMVLEDSVIHNVIPWKLVNAFVISSSVRQWKKDRMIDAMKYFIDYRSRTKPTRKCNVIYKYKNWF